MKKQIKYTLIAFILLISIRGISQCADHGCDPQLTGVGFINQGCIPNGGYDTLIVNWAMGGGDPYCTAPAGSLRLEINIPLTKQFKVNGISSIFQTGRFTWTWSEINQTFTGLNSDQINWLDNAIVRISIKGDTSTNCNLKIMQAQVYVHPTFLGGCSRAYNNQISNDALQTFEGVLAPLPIDLASFTARNGKCGEVILNWKTASESNSDYVDVERSNDGKTFETVQRIKSANVSTGSDYSYTDANLLSGVRYFYRLKQVDFDGKSVYFNTILIEPRRCIGSDLSMEVHPNPAFDKVNVSMKGFNNDDNVKLIVTNALGEVVMIIPNASTSSDNEIKLDKLAAGIYNIKLEGYDNVTTKRFIKVE